MQEWTHTITIIGVMIAGFGLLLAMFWNMFSKLDTDIKSCVSRLDSHAQRLDGHAQRIDQLYLAWVQERKDWIQERKEFDSKFYALLEEVRKARQA